MQYYGNKTHLGAHLPFNFGFLDISKDKMIVSTEHYISNWLTNIPQNMVPNWVVRALVF